MKQPPIIDRLGTLFLYTTRLVRSFTRLTHIHATARSPRSSTHSLTSHTHISCHSRALYAARNTFFLNVFKLSSLIRKESIEYWKPMQVTLTGTVFSSGNAGSNYYYLFDINIFKYVSLNHKTSCGFLPTCKHPPTAIFGYLFIHFAIGLL